MATTPEWVKYEKRKKRHTLGTIGGGVFGGSLGLSLNKKLGFPGIGVKSGYEFGKGITREYSAPYWTALRNAQLAKHDIKYRGLNSQNSKLFDKSIGYLKKASIVPIAGVIGGAFLGNELKKLERNRKKGYEKTKWG